MYIVTKAYDDNTAEILDIITLQRQFMEEIDLINFSSKHDVLGLSVSNRKVNYIQPYSCTTFPSDAEADEYIRDNNLSYNNKRYMNGCYYIFEKNEINKYHVDYFVCTYRGDEVSYLGKNGKGYTPYIQAAQPYDKKTAKEKAAIMTQRSKTGTHWTTTRRAY